MINRSAAIRMFVSLGMAPLCAVYAWAGGAVESPGLPEVEPAPIVQALLDDPLNDEQARTDLLIFHGRWDELPGPESLTPDQRAQLALLRYDLTDPVFDDPNVDPLWRADAALKRGEPEICIELLDDRGDAQAALLLAEAYEQIGQPAEAVRVLEPWRVRFRQTNLQDPAELTACARALSALARLQGRPAQDYQLALDLLGRVREELDPAYWPAFIAEAELLIDKDNPGEGVTALTSALALNPRCSEAWAMLGRLSVRIYAFDRVSAIVAKLREINPQHPLADLVEAHSLLQQRDVDSAEVLVSAGISRFPNHREWLALKAAVQALRYDANGLNHALQAYRQVAPGHPLAHYLAGTYLAAARQYEQSEALLRQAVAMAPNWPQPRIELGLLLMQAARDADAEEELAVATRLDPFNKRAANQLSLLRELQDYRRIETEHFIVRYKPGIDEALARDMPEKLERIYRDVTNAFRHRPARKTLIELMPDEEHFAVRITGLPEIWTIAAATGDAIAMTPPREGAGQHGPYDWPNVIRHEFVHTVTLDKTRNRIPHWFTEACAVSQETAPRSYETCRLLAEALQQDRLFELDQINWGFIRPKTPQDRPLAYAQADWMLEYLAVQFGHQAIIDMLDLYRDGVPDTRALEMVTDQSAAAFMADFKVWATEQVQSWGLAEHPASERLKQVLAGQGEPLRDDELDELLKTHPDHPDLLRLVAEIRLRQGETEQARQAILRYADARPVDPWPHRALVELALASGDTAEVIGSLSALDEYEDSSGRWAYELARAYRSMGRYRQALHAIERAIDREPYRADYRELAAAIALQSDDPDQALRHVEALTWIEPNRAVHYARLAALYHRLGRAEDADRAARQAIEIDPRSPASRFLRKD